MPGDKPNLVFLANPPVCILSLLLVLQILAFYATPRTEYVPSSRPLNTFTDTLGTWQVIQQGVIEQEILDLLKADDTLSRIYVDRASQQTVSLFVAFFKSQRAGVSPHSPKVCLPGSGWLPLDSRRMPVTVPGLQQPVRVNRYTVAKGDQKSVVLYWYQTPHRVIANEYIAKLYTILDSVRYRRSDTSLVRVVVPVLNDGEAAAEQTAVRFVRSLFNPLREHLPA